MDYNKISKETFDYLYQSRASLNSSPLNAFTRILVELYVSQINGCDYCYRLHMHEALKLGVQQEKIDSLSTWPISTLFSKEEKIALQWADVVTHLDKSLPQLNLSRLKGERFLLQRSLQ